MTSLNAKSWLVVGGAMAVISCAHQTRGILHSDIREPVALSDAAINLEILRRVSSQMSSAGSFGMSVHGYLDAKSCSTNVLGWAKGDASVHSAREALRRRMESEIPVSGANRHLFVAALNVDQTFYEWFGVYSETCTFVGGVIFEAP